MAIYTLTARILDESSGQVRDVRQAPFAVLEPGQDREDLERELRDQVEQLELLAEEIRSARHDPGHRHHHWWMP